ncbi:MAG: hypothetical protein ACOYIC_09295 [Butyricicoccus sp.]
MKNVEIRNRAKERGVFLWEIAEKLGINDGNLSRRLRKELSESQKEQIFGIIDELSGEKRSHE